MSADFRYGNPSVLVPVLLVPPTGIMAARQCVRRAIYQARRQSVLEREMVALERHVEGWQASRSE